MERARPGVVEGAEPGNGEGRGGGFHSTHNTLNRLKYAGYRYVSWADHAGSLNQISRWRA